MPSAPRADPVALAGRRILLTGATGFIGRSLLDYAEASARLHGDDFEIRGLSRDPAAFFARHPQYASHAWLSMRQGDVLHLPAPDGAFTDVIHAAADTHSTADPGEWTSQIVDGTRKALEFASRAGATRFLHTSSGAVYGPQPHDVAQLAEEECVARPTSVYARAKRVAEQLCSDWFAANGLATVNARCFAFVGRHLPLDGPYAIGNFIRDALFGDEIVVQGDGQAIRSYLDARDMAHWLFHLLSHGAAGQACNVGSDHALSIAALARCVADALAPGKRVVIRHAMDAASARSVYVPSIARARALGLRPEISLEDALADVAAHVLASGRRP